MRPTLLVVAGPNGSGKTTVTGRLRRDQWSEGVEYLNPDDIARERFGDWNSESAIRSAAIWTTERRELLLRQGAGIAVETVFSAPDKVDFLYRAKALGYFVRFFFISTEDPRINAARVADRVMQGGHTVPIEKIVNRYVKSMGNLAAAVALADRVYLFDNSVDGREALLCARTEDGFLRKVYGPLSAWFHAAVDPLPKHTDFKDLRVP